MCSIKSLSNLPQNFASNLPQKHVLKGVGFCNLRTGTQGLRHPMVSKMLLQWCELQQQNLSAKLLQFQKASRPHQKASQIDLTLVLSVAPVKQGATSVENKDLWQSCLYGLTSGCRPTLASWCWMALPTNTP